MPRSTTNFINMGPNGEATPTFPGGLLLPTPPNFQSNAIRWVKEEGGVGAIAYVIETRIPGSGLNQLQLVQNADTPSTGTAGVTLEAHDSGAASTQVSAAGGGTGFSRTLLDNHGGSHFVGQPGNGVGVLRRTEQFSTNTNVFFNSSNASNAVTVPHGLFMTPQIIHVTAFDNVVGGIVGQCIAKDAVGMTIVAYSTIGGAINRVVNMTITAIATI